MVDENNYIKVYDMLGHEFFSKGSDAQLKKWGNSIQKIKEIKIESVKFNLVWYKSGIDTYKLLNTLYGGTNKI